MWVPAMDQEYEDAPPDTQVQESVEDKLPVALTSEERQWGMFAHL